MSDTREARLRQEHERFTIGDHVRHYGTKQWGIVTEVRPTHYGVELVVDRIVDHPSDVAGKGYWEGARIDLHKRKSETAVPEETT